MPGLIIAAILLIILFVFLPLPLRFILFFILLIYIRTNRERAINQLKKVKNLFMNMSSEKTCSLCSEKLRFADHIEFKDGVICESCATSLSPWVKDYSHLSLQGISSQLTFHIEKIKRGFVPSRIMGEVRSGDPYVLIDDKTESFKIVLDEENKIIDIIDFSEVESCTLEIIKGYFSNRKLTEYDVSKAQDELKRGDLSSTEEEYYSDIIHSTKHTYYLNDKRVHNRDYLRAPFAHTNAYYDFYIRMKVNHGHYEDLEFRLNSKRVDRIEYAHEDPNVAFDDYKSSAQRICEVISGGTNYNIEWTQYE